MKYVEQLIYKLIVWEDLLICEGKNEKNIYIYPVRKLEGVLWNCGVGSFVGSRRVCFEIVWVERGSKENEKAQQPRKTVQKQYFTNLSWYPTQPPYCFIPAKIFISESAQQFSIDRSALLSKFILFSSEYQSEVFRAFLRKLIFRIFSN